MPVECAAKDGRNARWKVTGNVRVCDIHKDKAISLMREAVSQVKTSIQELAEPQPEPSPPLPPEPSPPGPEPEPQPEPTPEPTPQPGPEPEPTPSPEPSPTTEKQDRYGINKIYPDVKGDRAQHWYMDQNNPTSDRRFKNWKNADLRKEADGSWSADGSGNRKYQVRLEGWSESEKKKFLNTEITVYSNVIGGQNVGRYAFQTYRGGGHHSSRTPCEGCAYKARVRTDGRVVIVKEVIHPDYTSNRGGIASLIKNPIGNYIGVKQVVYNLPRASSNGRYPVKIEVYVDENGMDSTGNFDSRKQSWKKMAETVDSGGWSSGTGGSCPAIEIGNTGSRKPDEILNTPGGTEEGNLAAYRTDGVRSKIKYFSIREITPPVIVTPPPPTDEEEDPPTGPEEPEPPIPEPGKSASIYLHEAVNKARQQNGRRPVEYDKEIEVIALKHSKDMLNRNYFSHVSPDGKRAGDRLREGGYTGFRSWSENIAWFSTSRLSRMSNEDIGLKLFSQWWNSPAHKSNILRTYSTHEGIGIARSGNKIMATQVLVGK